MNTPDPEALRAAADQRIREQIDDAERRRTRRRNQRAALQVARNAGLTQRHTNRLNHLLNNTVASSAA